jgi:hypothetical protein
MLLDRYILFVYLAFVEVVNQPVARSIREGGGAPASSSYTSIPMHHKIAGLGLWLGVASCKSCARHGRVENGNVEVRKI